MDVNADTINIEEIYCIGVIDNKHGEDNNNDLAIDCYDMMLLTSILFEFELISGLMTKK